MKIAESLKLILILSLPKDAIGTDTCLPNATTVQTLSRGLSLILNMNIVICGCNHKIVWATYIGIGMMVTITFLPNCKKYFEFLHAANYTWSPYCKIARNTLDHSQPWSASSFPRLVPGVSWRSYSAEHCKYYTINHVPLFLELMVQTLCLGLYYHIFLVRFLELWDVHDCGFKS